MCKREYCIIDKNGDKIEFKTQKEASKFMGIHYSSLSHRLQKMTLQEAYDYDYKYSIIDKNGIKQEFKTQKEASKFMGIPYETLFSRLQKMSLQEAYDYDYKDLYKYTIIDKDGILRKFKTHKEFADFINISLKGLKKRLKAMTLQEAYDYDFKFKYEIIDKDGINRGFKTQKEAADFMKIPHLTLDHRLKTMSLQEACDFDYKYSIIDRENIERNFKNIKEFSEFANIPYPVLFNRIKNKNMTPQKAYDYDYDCKYKYAITDKGGVVREFKSKKEAADFMKVSYATLTHRLKIMKLQEAYDFDYKFKVFGSTYKTLNEIKKRIKY